MSICLLFGCNGKSEEEIAIERGRLGLERIQREDGAIADTTNPLFDIWETIWATQALFENSQDSNKPSISKALEFLRQNENEIGLVCHNQKCKAGLCLETSAEYIQLRSQLRPNSDFSKQIISISTLQKPDGSWDIQNPNTHENPNYPSVTGFVLKMFELAGRKIDGEEMAIQWLCEKQNTEGNWGKSWEYYECSSYAIMAILPILKNSKQAEAEIAAEKAENFALKTQLQNGEWFESGDGSRKMPSAVLQTAFMLKGLSKSNGKSIDLAKQKAVKFLLAQQLSNGLWDGGDFPTGSPRYVKREYVIATALSILAIKASIQ